jgi:hypothetical protein
VENFYIIREFCQLGKKKQDRFITHLPAKNIFKISINSKKLYDQSQPSFDLQHNLKEAQDVSSRIQSAFPQGFCGL